MLDVYWLKSRLRFSTVQFQYPIWTLNNDVLRHRWHFFRQIIYPHRALFIGRLRITFRAWNSDKANQHKAPAALPMCALVAWGVCARSNMIAEYEQCPFKVAFLLFHIHFIKLLFIVWMKCILRARVKEIIICALFHAWQGFSGSGVPFYPFTNNQIMNCELKEMCVRNLLCEKFHNFPSIQFGRTMSAMRLRQKSE